VIVLDRLVIGGLRFILEQLAAVVEREMDDEGRLKEELLVAEMRLELGEIDDFEFAAIEAEILPRLREIRARRQGWPAAGSAAPTPVAGQRVVGIEVSYGGDPRDRR
jgi:gas vesicle protein GvpG